MSEDQRRTLELSSNIAGDTGTMKSSSSDSTEWYKHLESSSDDSRHQHDLPSSRYFTADFDLPDQLSKEAHELEASMAGLNVCEDENMQAKDLIPPAMSEDKFRDLPLPKWADSKTMWYSQQESGVKPKLTCTHKPRVNIKSCFIKACDKYTLEKCVDTVDIVLILKEKVKQLCSIYREKDVRRRLLYLLCHRLEFLNGVVHPVLLRSINLIDIVISCFYHKYSNTPKVLTTEFIANSIQVLEVDDDVRDTLNSSSAIVKLQRDFEKQPTPTSTDLEEDLNTPSITRKNSPRKKPILSCGQKLSVLEHAYIGEIIARLIQENQKLYGLQSLNFESPKKCRTQVHNVMDSESEDSRPNTPEFQTYPGPGTEKPFDEWNLGPPPTPKKSPLRGTSSSKGHQKKKVINSTSSGVTYAKIPRVTPPVHESASPPPQECFEDERSTGPLSPSRFDRLSASRINKYCRTISGPFANISTLLLSPNKDISAVKKVDKLLLTRHGEATPEGKSTALREAAKILQDLSQRVSDKRSLSNSPLKSKSALKPSTGRKRHSLPVRLRPLPPSEYCKIGMFYGKFPAYRDGIGPPPTPPEELASEYYGCDVIYNDNNFFIPGMDEPLPTPDVRLNKFRIPIPNVSVDQTYNGDVGASALPESLSNASSPYDASASEQSTPRVKKSKTCKRMSPR